MGRKNDIDQSVSASSLFRECCHALGLGSDREIARALWLSDVRTIRHWKDDERPISGPAWVALRELLRQQGRSDLAVRIDSEIGPPSSSSGALPPTVNRGPH